MDETALIAMGILMEETAREVLGETGDLAFTEAADEEEERILAEDDSDEGEEGASIDSAPKTELGRSETWSSSDEGSRYATEESD